LSHWQPTESQAGTLNKESKRLLLHGMQDLVSALAEVMGITDGAEEELRH
jgi:hypothetical protein